jgi:two-component system, LytTR family, sensor kinase
MNLIAFFQKRLLSIPGIIIVGFLFPFVLGWDEYYLLSSFFATFYTALHWFGTLEIIAYFQNRYPDLHQTQKRLMMEVLAVILMLFVINWGVAYMIDIVILNHKVGLTRQLRVTVLAAIFTLLASAIYESIYFFNVSKKSLLETEKLKNENLQAQFAVLKNQVSPHFLFNSLNTLMTIIPENSDLALRFTDQLSAVYRYILQNRDKELVSLATEMEFVKSYIFLHQIRFGDSLRTDIQIPETYEDWQIAPLTLQILVENAIKHNVVSASKPLTIRILIENDNILIINNLQKKKQMEVSTQVGLQNIQFRYEYLGKLQVEVSPSETEFKVKVPLIATHEKLMMS